MLQMQKKYCWIIFIEHFILFLRMPINLPDDLHPGGGVNVETGQFHSS